jgi:hypothetical protein
MISAYLDAADGAEIGGALFARHRPLIVVDLDVIGRLERCLGGGTGRNHDLDVGRIRIEERSSFVSECTARQEDEKKGEGTMAATVCSTRTTKPRRCRKRAFRASGGPGLACSATRAGRDRTRRSRPCAERLLRLRIPGLGFLDDRQGRRVRLKVCHLHQHGRYSNRYLLILKARPWGWPKANIRWLSFAKPDSILTRRAPSRFKVGRDGRGPSPPARASFGRNLERGIARGPERPLKASELY